MALLFQIGGNSTTSDMLIEMTLYSSAPLRPFRVLQVVAMLHNGGPERWLVDLCQFGNTENLAMDIAVLWEINGLFYDIARERGIPIYHCPAGNPLQFIARLRRLLREHGPYDAIHCHLHAYSFLAVLAARLEHVPVRVVHSHNVVKNSARSMGRRLYAKAARFLIGMFATAGFGPSSASVEDLFGPDWKSDPRWNVLPCGIDLTPFRSEAGPGRAEFGIPTDALVLGSVGRLTPEKNSAFLVDVLAAVLRLRKDAYLLIIGEGELREQLDRKALEGGFAGRLILPGTRSDVPAIMRFIMDVFVFPSPPPPRGNEALPIAIVEAQAAGLPTVASDGVPPEAILVPGLIIQVPADAGATKWAEAVVEFGKCRDAALALEALAIIERSNHNCAVNIKVLAALYRDARVSPRAIISAQH